ncbi:MAG TPA: hypothetical protein VGM20_08810 [Gemmatimonadales bacterium]|jgi:hypothetical protein
MKRLMLRATCGLALLITTVETSSAQQPPHSSNDTTATIATLLDVAEQVADTNVDVSTAISDGWTATYADMANFTQDTTVAAAIPNLTSIDDALRPYVQTTVWNLYASGGSPEFDFVATMGTCVFSQGATGNMLACGWCAHIIHGAIVAIVNKTVQKWMNAAEQDLWSFAGEEQQTLLSMGIEASQEVIYDILVDSVAGLLLNSGHTHTGKAAIRHD